MKSGGQQGSEGSLKESEDRAGGEGQGGLGGPLTRPSVKALQILIIWSSLFLFFVLILHLLGAQDSWEGSEGGLELTDPLSPLPRRAP